MINNNNSFFSRLTLEKIFYCATSKLFCPVCHMTNSCNKIQFSVVSPLNKDHKESNKAGSEVVIRTQV